MNADFRKIADVLCEHALRVPTLNMLIPDSGLYKVGAIQPGGRVMVREDFVGHEDRTGAIDRFTDFLHKAKENAYDVALSPEYSCPWEVVKSCVVDHILPDMGRIWILGCEAIKPEELRTLTSELTEVVWIYEAIPSGTGMYLDVLAYVTKAEGVDGVVRNVAVLQFKTQAMGGDSFERDHLIVGRTVYVWHNPLKQVRLVSFVCADVLEFDDDVIRDLRFDQHPYVVFHPQLVTDPKHAQYRSYRQRLFAKAYSEHIEVLTLNWAREFVLDGGAPNPYGGSAVYTKSAKFRTDEERVNANHRMAMFYTRWKEQRTELCHFGFDEHVFVFRMPKTWQDTVATLVQRTGPEMVGLDAWDAAGRRWCRCEDSNDGFRGLCESFGQDVCDYCLCDSYSPVDRERLLTLSSGTLHVGIDWYQVAMMDSFMTEPDERSKRLTFTHESTLSSDEFRRKHIARYIALNVEILAQPNSLPASVRDLADDWKLVPPKADSDYRFNVVSRSESSQGATAIFVDSAPAEYVERLKDDIVRAWGAAKTRRLVVWYRSGNAIRSSWNRLAEITDDLEPPASIVSRAEE